ncbi:MAG TPA: MBL fold metallo-hydrolase [Clostridiales bacterium]|nr:MBL fold metallo-hydrolase [Clostridiales bacterium]
MDKERKVLIQYLYHSGFALELEHYFVIFDYYESKSEKLPENIKQSIKERISSSKYPFVFASHSHHDHFSPDIFRWKAYNPNITYVLSNDIKENSHCTKDNAEINCAYMGPYEKKEINNICISTYGSTDAGVSFALDIEGIRIFHAGDLNWWHWADESTEEELKEAEHQFKSEVSRIEGKPIDIMFFPVDPRLGKHYWMGGAYMLETFRPSFFVPMHFAGDCYITEKFAKRMVHAGIPIAEIDFKGQIFEYIK